MTALSELMAAVQAELDNGQFDAARLMCLSALEDHSQVAQLHAWLCYASQQCSRHDDAVRHHCEAIKLDPASWLSFISASRSFQALGRLEEARDAAQQARRLLPADVGTLYWCVELEAIANGVPAAFSVLAEAADAVRGAISPAEMKALLQRAARVALHGDLERIRAALDSGDAVGAEALIRASLQAAPEFGELHELLAYCLQQQLRYQDAIVAAASAMDVNPTSWLALLARGRSLKASGLLAEARACFELASAAHPTDADFQKELLEATLATRGFSAAEIMMRDLPEELIAPSVRLFWRAIRVENGRPDLPVPDDTTIAAVLRSAADWAEDHGVAVVDCGPIESDPFAVVRMWDAADLPAPVMVPGNRPYVVELPDVTIFSGSSLITTSDNRILNDVGAHPEFGRYASWGYDPQVLAQSGRSVVLNRVAPDADSVEGGILLAGLASDAFGHWVPEYLGRLPWLQQHPSFKELPLIVDEVMPQSHFDYLELVSERPLMKLPKGKGLRCARLLYSPPSTFFPVELMAGHPIPVEYSGMLSVSPLRWLRATVLERVSSGSLPAFEPKSGKKRWFLGRRNLKWRRLLNEAEITQKLEEIGFNVVYPEDMTLREQIAMFREAEAIVAPNGSALLNLIFAPPEVALIVLTQGALFNWGGFQAPMEALGYRFSWVASTDRPVNAKHADYRIDPDAILQALAARGQK